MAAIGRHASIRASTVSVAGVGNCGDRSGNPRRLGVDQTSALNAECRGIAPAISEPHDPRPLQQNRANSPTEELGGLLLEHPSRGGDQMACRGPTSKSTGMCRDRQRAWRGTGGPFLAMPSCGSGVGARSSIYSGFHQRLPCRARRILIWRVEGIIPWHPPKTDGRGGDAPVGCQTETAPDLAAGFGVCHDDRNSCRHWTRGAERKPSARERTLSHGNLAGIQGER